MPWVGFEPEGAKTVHALNRSATVTGILLSYYINTLRVNLNMYFGCVFRIILNISNDYSLNIIKSLACRRDMPCVFCQVRTKLLNIN
jgi:hypothetical protein